MRYRHLFFIPYFARDCVNDRLARRVSRDDNEVDDHGVPPVKWSMFWDNFIPRYGGSKDDSQTGKGRRHSYEASAG